MTYANALKYLKKLQKSVSKYIPAKLYNAFKSNNTAAAHS